MAQAYSCQGMWPFECEFPHGLKYLNGALVGDVVWGMFKECGLVGDKLSEVKDLCLFQLALCTLCLFKMSASQLRPC